MTEQERMVPVFLPPLASLLREREERKGAPLTREEVLATRDRATCMMMRESKARRLQEERGYRDVDPDRVWDDWVARREEFAREE